MNKKVFSSGVVAILVIGAIVGIYLWKDLSTRPQYSQIDVRRGSISEQLSISGKVQSQTDSDLGFEIDGKIVELTHQVGDKVNQGDILAKLDDSDLATQLRQAQDSAMATQGILDEYQNLKDKEKHKLTSLKKTDAISSDKKAQEEQIDAQQSLIDSQQSAVQAALDNVQSKKIQLDKAVLRAPFSGVITKQDSEVGEIASSSTKILTLSDENNFEIDAYVSQIDVNKLKKNDEAQVSFLENPAQKYQAKVTQIDPAGTDVNGVTNYKVVLKFDQNISGLRSGMDAQINLSTSQDSDAIIVPQTAVFHESGKKFVYVPVGNLRQKKEVTTGIYGSDGNVEILSGLGEGDQVLSLNQ
jgi:macrolide-specific efflux system membrane fusion protein